jgi:PKD domain
VRRAAHRRRRNSAASLALGCCLAALWFGAAPTQALILQPSTIDGPSAEGLSLGGVAMAPDGTGGLVYTKTVGGVQHVFASRYNGSQWSGPVRVDGEGSFAASQPRIAAGNNGRLLVVWVTPVATLAKGQVRYGLWSASLGPGAEEFSSALLIDANVGEGTGVDPSLAGTTPGNAIVAYRVVTYAFPKPATIPNPPVQLRPGDVMAEIRAARLEGGRWSKVPTLNRNVNLSMRSPTEDNAPQVAIGATGRAVVAWQEPDQSGAARILMRRITGTTPGPVFLASPETWNGRPVTEDATAFSLGVTAIDRARLAVLVEGSAGGPSGGPRVFLTSFGSSSVPGGNKPVGPELADGAGGALPGPLGLPGVAAAEGMGSGGSLLLAFASGSSVRTVGLNAQGALLGPETISGPAAQAGTPMVAAVDPEGGNLVAYEGVGEEGLPAVAVHQTFAEGSSQTGLLYGPIGGQISQFEGSASGAGDGLIAFRQGEGGESAIVADRIAAAPTSFSVQVPEGWVAPGKAMVRWAPPQSAVGGLVYGLLVNGRMVRSGLQRLRFTPPPVQLYDGVGKVQVVATDRLGEEVLSRPARMKVDSQPPRMQLRIGRSSGFVRLKLKDAQSGLVPRATRVAFGDGVKGRRGASFTHHYKLPGTYKIRLRAEDRVGNVLDQRVSVTVK